MLEFLKEKTAEPMCCQYALFCGINKHIFAARVFLFQNNIVAIYHQVNCLDNNNLFYILFQ